jgi:hypothetical protein
MNQDTSYYSEIETQIRLKELEAKIQKGQFTNPPSNDIDDIKSFFKKEYNQYSDLISSTDYIKPHVQGRDVGGEIDESVKTEMKEKLDEISDKIIKAKERHMESIIEGVTKDSIHYDKEAYVGEFDINYVSDERDSEIISEINEVVSEYCMKEIGRPLITMNIYQEDVSDAIKSEYSDPCIAKVAIAFNSKELKKEGVDIDDVISNFNTKLRDEKQLPVKISDDINKIPDHRMLIDNKNLVFTENEWSSVNSKYKKEIKSAVKAPTVDSISARALSMKL